MTYDELKAAINSWSERAYDDATMDQFIDLAEANIRRLLVGYQREVTGSWAADADGEVALPSDFLGIRAIYDGDVPYRYNISGSTLHVIDGAGHTFDVTYYAKLPALGDTNQSNWLIETAPDIYLFMCRAYQCAFEEDTNAQAWRQSATDALSDLNLQNTVAQYGRTGLRLAVAP